MATRCCACRRRQHLDERRGRLSNESGSRKTGLAGAETSSANPPLTSSDQNAFRAQVRLSDPAVKTASAIQLRVDDDAIALPDRARARVGDLAGHFVAP
jgi:hypothetical protein